MTSSSSSMCSLGRLDEPGMVDEGTLERSAIISYTANGIFWTVGIGLSGSTCSSLSRLVRLLMRLVLVSSSSTLVRSAR